MNPDKIKTLSSLARISLRFRRRGKRVVLANGCFDLLHVGHIRYLAGAKALGDILIVAVNGDRSVRGLKGKGRPLMPASARAELVAGFSSADYVTVFQESSVEGVLNALQPNIHAKGSDYTPETVPERAVVQSYGGRIRIVGGPKVRSTRNVIRQIRELYYRG